MKIPLSKSARSTHNQQVRKAKQYGKGIHRIHILEASSKVAELPFDNRVHWRSHGVSPKGKENMNMPRESSQVVEYPPRFGRPNVHEHDVACQEKPETADDTPVNEGVVQLVFYDIYTNVNLVIVKIEEMI